LTKNDKVLRGEIEADKAYFGGKIKGREIEAVKTRL
jgi:hypothetical protein